VAVVIGAPTEASATEDDDEFGDDGEDPINFRG
jgi:hypothetical protein